MTDKVFESSHKHNMVYNYRLTVAYDGADYYGWQKQNVKDRIATVQGVLESLLSKITNQHIKLIGASRTDAGVNASGQVCNFLSSKQLNTKNLKNVLNDKLPKDISVLKMESADREFNSRFNAHFKEYEYRIYNSPDKPVFDSRCLWVKKPLNIKKMKSAAKYFTGRRDFSIVGKFDGVIRNPVCNLSAIKVFRKGSIISIIFKSDRFLWNMARNIAGVLVNAGRGRFSLADIRSAVLGEKSKNNIFLRKPLDPQGLILRNVKF